MFQHIPLKHCKTSRAYMTLLECISFAPGAFNDTEDLQNQCSVYSTNWDNLNAVAILFVIMPMVFTPTGCRRAKSWSSSNSRVVLVLEFGNNLKA